VARGLKVLALYEAGTASRAVGPASRRGVSRQPLSKLRHDRFVLTRR
jgi:hypothetical protein